MLSKLFKCPEDSLDNFEPFSADFTRIQQRRLWKTRNLNLYRRIFFYKRSFHFQLELIEKKMMKKYYGKKTLFVIRPQEKDEIISRSKLLKYVKIEGNRIVRNNLRSKSNALILGNSLCFRDGDKIYSKRILKYCQKANFMVYNTLNLRLLVCMVGLKHLSMKVFPTVLKVFSFCEIIKNLLSLETIRLDFYYNPYSLLPFTPRYNSEYLPRNNNFSKGLFSQFHKLFRLKKVKLIFNDQMLIDDMNLERDLDNFYSQPTNFHLRIRIVVHKQLEIENNANLAKILRVAELLCLDSSGGPEFQMRMSKDAKKRMKFGKKNPVEIWFRRLETKADISQALSCCDSLESLYIKERVDEFCWEASHGIEEEIKGCRGLKNIVLDFHNFSADHGNQASQKSQMGLIENQSRNSQRNLSSPLLTILIQIRKNCHALQDLSLYLTVLHFTSLAWNPRHLEDDLGSILRNFEGIMQEISTFEKVKTFGMWTIPEDLSLVSPEKIIAAQHLEAFQLRLCRRSEAIPCSDWDNLFERVASSKIKELKIKTNEQTKVSLYGIKLLNFIRKLENLEVVELVDEELKVIQFDFLNNLVISLLEKKNMRKIWICTRVMKSFYSKSLGDLNLRSLDEELQNMLVRDWESRVKVLQLEEIFVGRLEGYSFDYLFYDKRMQIVDKLFWSKNEMDRLLGEKKEFGSKYQEVFDLFNKKEASGW